jgi:general secretion pathway protein A
MYTPFFNLKQAPFSIAPDPNYLFMSERHREALAHLLFGVGRDGGFVLLTGEIGAGKTTVCRCFLEQIPERCKVAYIFNPKLSVVELLRTICDEFHISPVQKLPGEMGEKPMGEKPMGEKSYTSPTIKEYVDALNIFLLETHAQGQNNVLIIDEAQNLSPMVLEQLRLLTNLETNQRKLLQIILIGQPELRTMLAAPELEQLAQRVIARYHLGPLSVKETGRYIRHRLGVAGLQSDSPFGQRLLPLIQRLTGGVPRRINLLCDRAMLGAYSRNTRRVDRRMIKQSAQEVFGTKTHPGGGVNSVAVAIWVAAATFLLLAAAFWHYSNGGRWMPRKADANRVAANPANPANPASPASAVIQASPANPASAVIQASTATSAPEATPADATPVLRGTQANAAFNDLAKLWNQTLNGPDPCQSAIKKNLRCFSGTGGWPEIRQLGQPALLALHDEARGDYYALLLALDEKQATLRFDGEFGPTTQVISLADLKPRFRGEFTTLISISRRFRDQVMLGDKGLDVDWLAVQLAQILRLPKPQPNRVYDRELERQVRQFQTLRKIRVDGLVGAQTYILINQSVGSNDPRLLDKWVATAAPAGK